jgi:predicted small secreted protein
MKGTQLMKKLYIIISILLLPAVLLTACSTSGAESAVQAAAGAETQVDATKSDAQAGASETENEFSMPTSMQLVFGIIKLEQTDYAIQADQAQELLTLWKATRSLSESETAATEEIEAVLNQIWDTLTPEQKQVLEEMDISDQGMGAIAEELGLEFGGGSRFDEMTPEMQATIEAMRASGESPRGMFGSDFPGGGQGGGAGGGFGSGGEQLSPEARETAIAERGGFARAGAGLGLNPAFIDAIIEFLQAKVE